MHKINRAFYNLKFQFIHIESVMKASTATVLCIQESYVNAIKSILYVNIPQIERASLYPTCLLQLSELNLIDSTENENEKRRGNSLDFHLMNPSRTITSY